MNDENKIFTTVLIIGVVFYHAQTLNIRKNSLEEQTYEELEKEFYNSPAEK